MMEGKRRLWEIYYTKTTKNCFTLYFFFPLKTQDIKQIISPISSSDFYTCVESRLTLKVIHHYAMIAILNMLIYSFPTKVV